MNKITNIIGGVSLVLAGYAFYSAWGSVGTSIKHNSDYALMKGLAIQNLKDVQSAQKEYEKKYDVFAIRGDFYRQATNAQVTASAWSSRNR